VPTSLMRCHRIGGYKTQISTALFRQKPSKTLADIRLFYLGTSENRCERAKFAPRSGPLPRVKRAPQARNLTAQQVLRRSHYLSSIRSKYRASRSISRFTFAPCVSPCVSESVSCETSTMKRSDDFSTTVRHTPPTSSMARVM
jgi:hypothetical protein